MGGKGDIHSSAEAMLTNNPIILGLYKKYKWFLFFSFGLKWLGLNAGHFAVFIKLNIVNVAFHHIL